VARSHPDRFLTRAPRSSTRPRKAGSGPQRTLIGTLTQVSTVADADRVERLGVGRVVGLGLVLVWLAVLVVTIVLRRRLAYAEHKPLFWWEAFYRTGSIIFGGGQVGAPPHPLTAWGNGRGVALLRWQRASRVSIVREQARKLFQVVLWTGLLCCCTSKASAGRGAPRACSNPLCATLCDINQRRSTCWGRASCGVSARSGQPTGQQCLSAGAAAQSCLISMLAYTNSSARAQGVLPRVA
jgi:hypothetical protein